MQKQNVAQTNNDISLDREHNFTSQHILKKGKLKKLLDLALGIVERSFQTSPD